MRYHRMSTDQVAVFDADGGRKALGRLLCGEDGVIRFFSNEELLGMEGIGLYNGGSGYCVYEDGQGSRFGDPGAALAERIGGAAAR